MLPVFLFINFTLIEHTVHLYIVLVEYHSCCPHGFRSVESLLGGAEPRFELGPALQQAAALYCLSHAHAAPFGYYLLHFQDSRCLLIMMKKFYKKHSIKIFLFFYYRSR
jgi:hypothetical protein